MTEEMYKQLNFYLNGVFKELEKDDSFFINNILQISIIGNKLLTLIEDYDLKKSEIKANLTYNDVYLLAREIIEKIDKNYLKYYDKLIESGEIDFNYEGDYADSACIHCFTTGQNFININMEFNYLDVATLVHEFMHYTNVLTKLYSINRHIITEAISIYFEEFAKIYLLKKGIDKSELWFSERLYYTSNTIKNFDNYNIILLAYSKFGNINKNTYKMLNQFFLHIPEEEFEKMCINELKLLEKKSKEIEFKIKMEYGKIPNDYEQKLFCKLIRLINVDYKYIFGTMVAYNALEKSSLEQMVYLNNNINEINLGIGKLLESINVKLEELDFNYIKKVLEEGKIK